MATHAEPNGGPFETLDSLLMPQLNRFPEQTHDIPFMYIPGQGGEKEEQGAMQGSAEAETQRLVRESRARAEQRRRQQDLAKSARERAAERIRNRLGPTADRKRSAGREGLAQTQIASTARPQQSGPRVYTEALLRESLAQLALELMLNEQKLKFADPLRENVGLFVKTALPGLFERVRENNVILARKVQQGMQGPQIPSEFFFARTKWMVEMVYMYLTDILRGRRSIAPGYKKERVERFSAETLSALKMEHEDWH